MGKHYFASDGNYGNAEKLIIANTSKWTTEDWVAIEEANDNERTKVAARIERKHKNANS